MLPFQFSGGAHVDMDGVGKHAEMKASVTSAPTGGAIIHLNLA